MYMVAQGLSKYGSHYDVPSFKEMFVCTFVIFKIPESLSFEGYVTSGIEALLLLLRRLSSLVRYQDISMEFDLLPQVNEYFSFWF